MDYFLIARIEQLYGKGGFVKLKSYSDFPERYLSLKEVFIDFWGDKKKFYVQDVKDVKGNFIIKFVKFDSPRDSQVLIDREMYVSQEYVVKLPENHFFIHDMIGSEVYAGKEILGVITDVIKAKANDVLVILTNDKKEKLIPFVLNIIEKFDTARKRLVLNVTKEYLEDDED